jgi:hypothetical protein
MAEQVSWMKLKSIVMFKTGTKELFQKYPNPVFIETGSFIGDGIQAALDAGFETIYSIEISASLFLKCVDRFYGNEKVHLIYGDSSLLLDRLLSTIKVPATFWLDGHNSGVDPETGILTSYGVYERPVFYELGIIQNHFIKTHTILIDDLRLWSEAVDGFDTNSLVTKCSQINPDYKFTFENGYVPNDILAVWL